MIPYGKHHIDEDDIAAVVNVLRNGALTQGPVIDEFEKEICAYTGAKYAVAVSSGTGALHLASLAAGIREGVGVLTTPITFVATANAAIYAGGYPVFSDINPDNVNISIRNALQTINKNKNIGAVMPVHFSGLACEMEELFFQSSRKGLYVIEDAAHALGARYKTGERVGSCKYSDMTIFSLHPVKSIAAGEGGVITTNKEEIYRHLLRLRSHGINKLDDNFLYNEQSKTGGLSNPWYYEMQELGFHYRITDIQCALALSQLKKLDAFIEKRRAIAAKYNLALQRFVNCKPAQDLDNIYSSHHLFVLRIRFDRINISRAELMARLRHEYGIITQVHYMPIPMHPFYSERGYSIQELSSALNYYEECLSIPIYYDLTDQQQDLVISALGKLVG